MDGPEPGPPGWIRPDGPPGTTPGGTRRPWWCHRPRRPPRTARERARSTLTLAPVAPVSRDLADHGESDARRTVNFARLPQPASQPRSKENFSVRANSCPDQARRGAARPHRRGGRPYRAQGPEGRGAGAAHAGPRHRRAALRRARRRPFFGELVEFITSGPLVALVPRAPAPSRRSAHWRASPTRSSALPARSAATSRWRSARTSCTV